MTKNKQFGWCFIGTGALAHIVAKQLSSSSEHRIVSIYTRRPESGKAFEAEFGGKYCSTVEEAISMKGVDAVYVVTPHTSHVLYTEMSLKMKKPVLCEKPIAVTYSDTKNIDCARSNDTYLSEAMWTWFSPIAGKVREWIRSGILGDIVSADAVFEDTGMFAPRVKDPMLVGGALLDIGVYSIAYLYKLFGAPDRITCEGELENGIDMHEICWLIYKDRVFCASSAVDAKVQRAEISIVGTNGRIHVPSFYSADRAELILNDGGREEIWGDGSYLNEFDIVRQEIVSGKKASDYYALEDSLEVMKLVQEARKQLGLRYPFEMERETNI